jgi:hypothetical protein
MPPLDPCAARPALARGDTVFHVAYGSNLSLDKLRARTPDGRVPIVPRSQTPVTVPGFRLLFGLAAIPPVEPVMADVAPADGALLHGVLYEFSAYDYESLCMSEHCAIHAPSYVEEVVLAHPYENGRPPVMATLFIHARPERRVPESLEVYPSRRYLGLILSGAKDAGLDPLYIQMLEQLPVARPVVAKPAVLITGLSMYCIFSLIQHRYVPILMSVLKVEVLGSLVRVYALRERSARNMDRKQELFWAGMLLLGHIPFAIVGFILMAFTKAKVRIPFRE